MANTTTVLLCGVGGQGTILAADLLAKTAAASGMEVKLSEIHGMSQRGGSVNTIVRFGDEVHSMVCDPGCADLIVAFEEIEALRNLHFLADDGTMYVNMQAIPSLPVQIGAAQMPENPTRMLQDKGARLVNAVKFAKKAGNPKGLNVVLLGALSASLPFEEQTWEEVIRDRVPPKTVDANLKAFGIGRSLFAR